MRLPFALLPLLALTACGNPDTPAGRAADARHKNYEEIGDAFKQVSDEVKSGNPDLVKIREAADTINGIAPKVEGWFPAGSGPDDGIKTDALQTVWTKPEEFKAASAKFVDEAAKFNTLAIVGDIATLGAGLQALGGACKGCHDKFREAD